MSRMLILNILLRMIDEIGVTLFSWTYTSGPIVPCTRMFRWDNDAASRVLDTKQTIRVVAQRLDLGDHLSDKCGDLRTVASGPLSVGIVRWSCVRVDRLAASTKWMTGTSPAVEMRLGSSKDADRVFSVRDTCTLEIFFLDEKYRP